MNLHKRLFAWMTLGCVWLFYLYEYMLRVAPSSITGDLMLSLGMNATQLSCMLSLYYVAYVALQIPCGVIVDAWGPRRVMTWSCILCVLGTCLFIQIEAPWMVGTGRFLMGVGSTCAFLSCGKIATQWFEAKYFPIIMGVSMMMGLIGATLGSYIIAALTTQMGWQKALWITTGIGCVVTAIVGMGTREPTQSSEKTRLTTPQLWKELHIVIKNPSTWWLGLYGCCMYLPLSSFAELWSVPYVMGKYEVTRDHAVIPSVCFFWGGGFGCILSARIVSWWGKYRPIMLSAPILSCALFMLEFYGPHLPIGFVSVLFGLNGMLYGVHMMCFAIIKDSVSTQAAGTAIGFMNFCVMSSGLVGATMMGYVLDYVWDGQLINNAPHYTVDHYTYACSFVLACAFLLAAISIRCIREPQSIRSK